MSALPAPRSAIRLACAMAAAITCATAAAAQPAAGPEPTPRVRAIAAGYKAAMLCSGLFNAGRTEAQVEQEELTGIYPDYQPIVPTLAARIDRAQGVVEVDWSNTLPPRRAEWTADRGCTTLPIGAGPTDMPRTAPPPPAGADPRRWPMGDAGIRPRPGARLAATIERAFAGGYGGGARTVGVVIVHDGRIVGERYGEGWGPFVSNRTWSVAKSIAGTIIGQATGRTSASASASGEVPAPFGPQRRALPDWTSAGDPRGAITLDHLLRMASGLDGGGAGNRTDDIYFGGAVVDDHVGASLLSAAPGTRFRYANNDTLFAIHALRRELGPDAYRRIVPDFFACLGMRHTVAETDSHGNYILSSQVWSTARDLARLGLFWLQDGLWQGERLGTDGWMRVMTSPSGPQPASGPGYGATLWLFGPEQGLPAGSFAAQGNRGQYVMVVPERRLVVVRRGEDPAGSGFDIARFAADVAATLR